MSRILVVPERLRGLGHEWREVASTIRALNDRVARAANSLEWEAKAQGTINGDISRAKALATDLASKSEAIAIYLERTAESFRQADQQGHDAMQNLFRTYAIEDDASHDGIVESES